MNSILRHNPHPIAPKSMVSVIGAGRSGQAATKLLHMLGHSVQIHEENPHNMPEIFQTFLHEHNIICVAGKHTKKDFSTCNVLIPSPGIPIHSLIPFLPNNVRIISETELAWLYGDDSPVLAITGTSGKTTTTSLCTTMLKQHGYNVFTGGNIGTPLSEYVLARLEAEEIKSQNNTQKNLCEKVDIIVLELSSFQLQTCDYFNAQVALCLNISENHLDYHANMQEYIDAKMNIFKNQNKNNYAILGDSLKNLSKSYTFHANTSFFDNTITRFPACKLIGQHNQNNAEAAWQACRLFDVTLDEAILAVNSFEPLENRLEFISEINGIQYINDSKGTTVDALKTALIAVSESKKPLYLLAGGKFKGGDLEALIPLMQSHIKHIALFGGSQEIFSTAWEKHFPLTWDEHLHDAMKRLQGITNAGDIILLAPATSSFDQYKNYEARGADFRSIVHNLQLAAR